MKFVSEQQKENTVYTVVTFIVKIFIGLLSAIVIPIIALSIIITIANFYSYLQNHPPFNPSILLSNLGISFGVAIFVSFYATLYAIGCLVPLSIPAILIGWRLGLIRGWTSVISGFLLGSVPGALIISASSSSSYVTSSANGVLYWINGAPTLAGRIQFAAEFLLLGLLGALGGLSFWLVWRYFNGFDTKES